MKKYVISTFLSVSLFGALFATQSTTGFNVSQLLKLAQDVELILNAVDSAKTIETVKIEASPDGMFSKISQLVVFYEKDCKEFKKHPEDDDLRNRVYSFRLYFHLLKKDLEAFLKLYNDGDFSKEKVENINVLLRDLDSLISFQGLKKYKIIELFTSWKNIAAFIGTTAVITGFGYIIYQAVLLNKKLDEIHKMDVEFKKNMDLVEVKTGAILDRCQYILEKSIKKENRTKKSGHNLFRRNNKK